MDNDDRQQWGATAFVFVFLGLLLLFVFLVSRKPGEAPPPPAAAAAPDAVGSFWRGLVERAPEYGSESYACPVDATALSVPSRIRDNRYGGVASDLMKITLAPPEGGLGQPDLTQQEWELMPVSCPTCGATLMEIDFINLQSTLVPGAPAALKRWNLTDSAPALAEVPPAEWLKDEQLFVRYQTLKTAGFPGTELAYSALTCAYASNFSIWYGRDYAVPSPAYYALAAALMQADLAAGLPASEAERAAVMFDLGELCRLLGRADEAAAWFAKARDSGLLEESRLEVLAQLEGALGAGDYNLMRVEIAGLPAPPVGWYLDTMLPAINGHITEHRNAWSSMREAAQIEAAIEARIAARRNK